MSARRRKRIRNRVLLIAGVFLLLGVFLSLLYGAGVPKRYSAVIEAAAEEFSVESELLYAVVRAESGFDANAVSGAGAVGLMQIMPQTALFVEELSGRRLDVRDPAENIDLGTAYLRYLFGRFSSLTQVLAAYNAGEGTVRAWLSRADLTDKQGDLAHIPYPETARYVRRVKIFYNCYKFCYR